MAPTTRTGSRSDLRAERRARARSATRTAVLTVALPSAATLGVFAAAAVTVQHESTDRATPTPDRPDGSGTGTGLGTRATAGSREAELQEVERRRLAQREAERADRQRADQQQADQQRADREALAQRAQEAARPRYVLPVEQRGLSAGFGEAGSHWTARHTGIDFPVDSGTPVRAVTDGTVATRWSSAYGYLATVTAPDGTQTWYGHLRSYRVRKGQVRAGDVIAYSGSTGNSTGPHLHFEVRPDGETPVDPVPWLLGHGIDPRG